MDWLRRSRADVVCLQETRVLPDELPKAARETRAFKSFWMPGRRKGYSGVGVYVREPPLAIHDMGANKFDEEGRVQVLDYDGFSIVNAYYPNSQPERKRLDYKLEFCDTMRRLCNRIVKSGRHVIVCGDYNIAHTEIDLARPKANEKNPGYLPEEREAMSTFLRNGYVDTFRHFTKEGGHYSWWSFRANARAKNVGWRIDYHCVNKAFLPRVKKAQIHPRVLGSDHCPVSITID